jgi:hypothetical protein
MRRRPKQLKTKNRLLWLIHGVLFTAEMSSGGGSAALQSGTPTDNGTE